MPRSTSRPATTLPTGTSHGVFRLLISFFASYQMSYYASDEYRDHQGYLTDGEGNPLTDDGGNPLKEPTLLGNPFGMGGDLAVSAACMNWVGAFPFKRENKTHDGSLDVLVTGCEVSLWVGEQFASDLHLAFPNLSIECTSANKLLGLLGHSTIVE